MPIYDLIGFRVKVLWHTDPSIRGLDGIVLLESEKFLYIYSRDRVIMVDKHGGHYLFERGNFKFQIDGVSLVSKISNRLAKRRDIL